jgi:hypothetical protein
LDFIFKCTVTAASLVIIAFGVEHAFERYTNYRLQQRFATLAAHDDRCRMIGEDSERVRTGRPPVYLSSVSEVVAEWDKCRGL